MFIGVKYLANPGQKNDLLCAYQHMVTPGQAASTTCHNGEHAVYQSSTFMTTHKHDFQTINTYVLLKTQNQMIMFCKELSACRESLRKGSDFSYCFQLFQALHTLFILFEHIPKTKLRMNLTDKKVKDGRALLTAVIGLHDIMDY